MFYWLRGRFLLTERAAHQITNAMLRFQLLWLLTYASLGLTSDTRPPIRAQKIVRASLASEVAPPRYVPGGARTGQVPSQPAAPAAKSVVAGEVHSGPWGIHWAR